MLNKAIIISSVVQVIAGIVFVVLQPVAMLSPLSWVLMVNGMVLPVLCIFATGDGNRRIPGIGFIISGAWWLTAFVIIWIL